MEYFEIEILRLEFYQYLKRRTDFAEEELDRLSEIIETENIVHKVEYYMSEYIDETEINDETYLHYHCWFETDRFGQFNSFPHETYYLKSDVIDGTVESYIKAHKLYSI